jgi:hypothetical protein
MHAYLMNDHKIIARGYENTNPRVFNRELVNSHKIAYKPLTISFKIILVIVVLILGLVFTKFILNCLRSVLW